MSHETIHTQHLVHNRGHSYLHPDFIIIDKEIECNNFQRESYHIQGSIPMGKASLISQSHI